jgi:hypothetical protein
MPSLRPFAASTAWLSTMPEPERLLPRAVATLVANGRPPAAAVERERDRLERMIRRAHPRSWSEYRSRAQNLARERGEARDPDVVSARELTRELLADHENLMAGLRHR